MVVNKVPVQSDGSWDIPLAAILCLAIAVYVILVVIGLSIRQCLLRKGVCGNPCPDVVCCSCAELGLHCSQACCNCGRPPSCASCIDRCCPSHQRCSCLPVGGCEMCQDYYEDTCSGWHLEPPQCLSCTTPHCSTINCLCCEVTIKGMGPQGEG